jgi:hypothetical protein
MVTMKRLTFVGTLVTAFALGGVSTLLGLPRHAPATTSAAATISPEELTRAADPMPARIIENYF